MASILSKTGIQDNNTIRVWHITQSVDAFTGTEAYDITLSGSLTVVGDLNLNTNPTGTLIGNAAYSPTSSYSTYSVTSSVASTASISYDVLTFQMYHYETDPTQNTSYYFAINPSGSILTTTSSVGTFLPKELRILSASVTSFVNGTLASTETSSYALFLNTNSVYNFSNTLDHSNTSQYFIEKLDTDGSEFDENEIDLPLYIEWRTPTTWVTPPTSVSHNIVFYCTRGYSAP